MQYKYSITPLLHCLLLTMTSRFAFTINPWFSEQYLSKWSYLLVRLLVAPQAMLLCSPLHINVLLLSRKVLSCSYDSIAPETSVLVCLLCSPLKCTSLQWWEFSRGNQRQCSSLLGVCRKSTAVTWPLCVLLWLYM